MPKVQFLLGLFLSFSFLAQAEETASIDTASCKEQIKLYCANETKPRDVIKCLLKHDSELSQICKQEISRFVRASEQTSEQGGGALSALAGLNSLTPPFPVLTLEGRTSPGTPSLNEEKFNFAAPVYQSGDDSVSMSLGAAHVHFSDDVVLDSGLIVPQNLYRTEVGAQYNHKLPAFKTWGLRASIGSASDQLFKNAKDTTYSLYAQYGFPSCGGGYWMLILFISNNSPFGNYIPIPGFTYFYKTPTLTGLFGFPIFSMQWTPEPLWSYSFTAFGPSITTEAGYGDPTKIQSILNLSYSGQNFLLSERANEKDRLTVEEKKLSVGVRSLIWKKTLLEAKVGRAFGRVIYLGDGFRNMRSGSQPLDNESFLDLSLKTGF